MDTCIRIRGGPLSLEKNGRNILRTIFPPQSFAPALIQAECESAQLDDKLLVAALAAASALIAVGCCRSSCRGLRALSPVIRPATAYSTIS